MDTFKKTNYINKYHPAVAQSFKYNNLKRAMVERSAVSLFLSFKKERKILGKKKENWLAKVRCTILCCKSL